MPAILQGRSSKPSRVVQAPMDSLAFVRLRDMHHLTLAGPLDARQ